MLATRLSIVNHLPTIVHDPKEQITFEARVGFDLYANSDEGHSQFVAAFDERFPNLHDEMQEVYNSGVLPQMPFEANFTILIEATSRWEGSEKVVRGYGIYNQSAYGDTPEAVIDQVFSTDRVVIRERMKDAFSHLLNNREGLVDFYFQLLDETN